MNRLRKIAGVLGLLFLTAGRNPYGCKPPTEAEKTEINQYCGKLTLNSAGSFHRTFQVNPDNESACFEHFHPAPPPTMSGEYFEAGPGQAMLGALGCHLEYKQSNLFIACDNNSPGNTLGD